MSGQVWSVNTLGGYMYADQLSNVLRMALLPTVKFRQFCDAKDATEKGLHTGQLFNWNTYSRVTQGGGQISEDVDMPSTNFTVGQASLTITEYGNSVPYTGKLDDMSKHPVTEIIHKVLKVDAKETLDGAAWAQFNQTVLQVAPTGGNSATSVTSSVGPTGITNALAMNNSHVKAISDLMKEANIPPYVDDDYYAIAWPTTLRTFKNSLESIHQYVETGFQLIANGEIGRYEGIRFVEQTAIAHGGAVNASTYTFRNPVPWTGGLSDWCFFFGEDTVAEAMVIPEEIRGKIPTDFGRSRGIAWYYLGGFGLVHGATAGDVSNARIVKWNSAS
jgi:N4-gp56 family major capsid protein